MHMADALASPAVAAVMGAASVGVAAYSIYKIKKDETAQIGDVKGIKKVPLMAVMSAFVFAAQMLNFTIPGTGSSGHICGGLLLASLLGPYSAFISMIVILLLQCLIFADGGLMVLGCNIWNMAFYACFVGYFLIYRPILKNKFSRTRIMLASILGCVISLQPGAFSVVLETTISGITSLPFSTFVLLMQPIHLAIGLVEGVLTGLVLIFVNEVRPEMIQNTQKNSKLSLGKVIAIFGIITLIFAGGISLVASSNPDGLEWSIGRTTGSEEVESNGKAQEIAGNVVDGTAILPEYSIKGSESMSGTTVAGIAGSVMVAVVCGAACMISAKIRKKKYDNAH